MVSRGRRIGIGGLPDGEPRRWRDDDFMDVEASPVVRLPYRDRFEAGRVLADVVARSGAIGAGEKLVVVGLARGGVEVAAEVAAALHAPLDALAVRKIRHPWQPEYGLGAVAPGRVTYLRSSDGLTAGEVAEAVAEAANAAERLDTLLHEARAPTCVQDLTCVLVDDGLATGGTMVAAVRWARANGARKVVVAVPVGAEATVGMLERDGDVDAVVCPVTPADFGAVGFWFHDFHQVADADVRALLAGTSRGVVAM